MQDLKIYVKFSVTPHCRGGILHKIYGIQITFIREFNTPHKYLLYLAALLVNNHVNDSAADSE